MELLNLIRLGAAERPDQAVIESGATTLTYADVVAQSDEVACQLTVRDLARFACVISDAAALLPVLAGAASVGAEPCVYPATLDPAGIERQVGDLGHAAVVSDQPLTLAGTPVVPARALWDPGPVPATSRRLGAGSPLLILTTGTSGKPKAARHDWARLIAPVSGARPTPDARWLLAYNLNQFAAVQMLLHVLSRQATLVVPASLAPAQVAATIKEAGITHVSGTPTFWRLLCAHLDSGANVFPLQQITVSGEAVPAPVLDQLVARFPAAHISQIYASTEFGSALSVQDGRSGLPLSALERGDDADVQFRIRDGQLESRSQIGMLGYLGEPDAGEGWRPTGDLVEVRDGRILFVGRTSEVINVGGVKVHPLPVEELVGRVPGVAMAHAYGRPNAVTGQIVVLDVVAAPGCDTAAIETAIRAACEQLAPAGRPRRIRFVEQLEVVGQKVARSGGGSL